MRLRVVGPMTHLRLNVVTPSSCLYVSIRFARPAPHHNPTARPPPARPLFPLIQRTSSVPPTNLMMKMRRFTERNLHKGCCGWEPWGVECRRLRCRHRSFRLSRSLIHVLVDGIVVDVYSRSCPLRATIGRWHSKPMASSRGTMQRSLAPHGI